VCVFVIEDWDCIMGKDGDHVTKLGEGNYNTWVGEMCALLMTKEVWSLVKGECTEPATTEAAELKSWRRDRYIAVGQIYLALEPCQKVHVKGLEEGPVKMWAKLQSVHLQKCPATRFNALDGLFSIRKQEDETSPESMML
jgi:gag-polypeptide of LTR copia-type